LLPNLFLISSFMIFYSIHTLNNQGMDP